MDTKLKWCREHAPKALKNADTETLLEMLGDAYDREYGTSPVPFLDVSGYVPVSLMTTSKGNQQKWYDEAGRRYVKEQFYYQGRYWDDYKVEILSHELSLNLNTLGVKVLKQDAVRLGSTYGVVSDDFANGSSYVSIARLLKNSDVFITPNEFPLVKFKKIVNFVKDVCDLDITDYLLVMCVMDYILLNEDRHLNNFGVLYSADTGFTLAPLFDFGLGLFQHDRKYIGKTLDMSYAYVEGKPFHSDMSVIVSTLIKNGYKEKIRTIFNGLNCFDVSIIDDVKAQQHVDRALKSFYDWCR